VVEVRRADVRDAGELLRLRQEMWRELDGYAPEPGTWQQRSLTELRSRLAEPAPSLAAFVVASPETPDELASCAIGVIDRWLPGPRNPNGMVGKLHSVSTDPRYRRRGFSRACVAAIIEWFRDRGVDSVTLNASPQGEPLYASLGFVRSHDPAMWLYLPEVSRAR